MRQRKHIYVAVALAALLFFAHEMWAVVQLRGTTQLGRDYQYWRIPSGVLIKWVPSDLSQIDKLAAREGREGRMFNGLPTVGPDVDGYRVYSGIIAGHVRKPKRFGEYGDPIQRPSRENPAGYFIIDTRIDRVYDGLDKQAWLERLRRFGLTAEPELFKPSVYDKVLGRNKPTRSGPS